MGLKLVIAPATSPVSLTEAKAHLRVEHDEDDDLIEAMLEASVDYVDGPGGYLGRAIIDQTWDYFLDAFPLDPCGVVNKPIELPLPPLIEIVGVFYIDSGGTETEMVADTDYRLDDADAVHPARLMPVSSWPTADDRLSAVRIRFRAGYLDASVSPAVDNPPAAIKQAILLNLGNLYRNRETFVIGQTVAQLPWAAEQLLRRHRIYLSLA